MVSYYGHQNGDYREAVIELPDNLNPMEIPPFLRKAAFEQYQAERQALPDGMASADVVTLMNFVKLK